jgi:hypothetical protein
MHALDSKLSTSIIWDAITLPCNWSEITTWNSWAQDGTYTLTSVAGNLYYTGSVTITWSTGY